MRITIKILVILVASLLVTTTALADQTSYQGSLWDSDDPAALWQHGATVHATNCAPDGTFLGTEHYGSTDVPFGVSNFNSVWGTGSAPHTPTVGDYVCLYIIFNDGGAGTPASVITPPLPIAFFATGPMNFGNIQTGTGPNAIELVDFSVTPQANGSTWLPFALLIGSVALVSGAVAVIRKRKA